MLAPFAITFVAEWLRVHHRMNTQPTKPAFRHMPVQLRARAGKDQIDFKFTTSFQGAARVHSAVTPRKYSDPF